MAIPNHTITPQNPSAKASRISISASPQHSPIIVPAPASPAPSVHVQVGDRMHDPLNSTPSSRAATPTLFTGSDSLFSTASSLLDNPGGSPVGVVSPRYLTFSEEKEVVFGHEGSSSRSTITSIGTNDQRTPVTKPMSSHTPTGSLSRSSVRSGKSPRSAASELAAARRASIVNVARAENASKLEGLGLYLDRGSKIDDNSMGIDSKPLQDIQKIDGGKYEDAVIAAAQQAQMKRPRTTLLGPAKSLRVENATQEKCENHDMVDIENGETGVSLIKDVLGSESLRDIKDTSPQRFTRSSENAIPEDVLGRGASTFPLEHQNRKFSLLDALHSNPVDPNLVPKRAATVPARPRRKAKFSTLPAVDTQLGRRFRRESVLNTPYPRQVNEFPKEAGSHCMHDECGLESQAADTKSKELDLGETKLLVILHGRDRDSIKVGSVVIPALNLHGPEPALETASKPSSRFLATESSLLTTASASNQHNHKEIVGSFDDEALCRLLAAEYAHLRGSVRILLSARSLRGARILKYPKSQNLAYLSTQSNGHYAYQHIYGDSSGAMAEAELLQRLREGLWRPESREGKDDVIHWLKLLGSMKEADEDVVAFILSEDWNARRFGCAAVVVLLLSVAVAVLWTVLGVSVSEVPGQAAGGRKAETAMLNEMVYKGPGTRVETGAVLGIATLLVGWTGIAGWALLSWLVM
ncbi:hypothetical protein MMC13_006160 [Lambiella insularis]|nr:hypothetical protein [Lambiella insularis]